MGNLCPDKGTTSPQSSPAQNTRSKTTEARPNRATEVRTIEQEMVLACIETYVEVTQTPLQPAQCPIKIPHCNAQCSPQQQNRQTDGNAPLPVQLKVHKDIGQIVHQGAQTTSPRFVWNKRYRHHCLYQVGQNTTQQEEAHHLRKDDGYVSTREWQPETNEAYCWW